MSRKNEVGYYLRTSNVSDESVEWLDNSVSLIHEDMMIDVFWEYFREVSRVSLFIVVKVKLFMQQEPMEEVLDKCPHEESS